VKRVLAKRFLSCFVLLGVAGCMTGRALYLPGDLERPRAKGLATEAEAVKVAVIDFSKDASISSEIGRDYDNVRPILWKGEPGKSIAGLIADALAEKGFEVVRVTRDTSVPPDASATVWGRVEAFRVDARRAGSLKVEAAAHVALTLYGAGFGAPPGWNSAVAADFWYSDPLVITPDGLRQAMNGAANAAAEEAVRRLKASGVLPAAPSTAFGR
jgi:Holliday junction resolvase